MAAAPRFSHSAPPKIRKLDETAINRIAAGEVVERPASVVKELVENSIDAGASQIGIFFADGGKSLVRVVDDGCGISGSELELAISRHATSKIDGSDLLTIRTLGFRGEALPSIGAAGRLTIRTRAADSSDAFTISVDGGRVSPVRPVAHDKGTSIELANLFHSTPARLKFLRTAQAEVRAIIDVVKSLALANPSIGFELYEQVPGKALRRVFRLEKESGTFKDMTLARLSRVVRRDFAESSVLIDAQRGEITLTGFVSLPTYTRGAASSQFLFVNGRPVKDRLFRGALRAAYSDFIASGRHPVAALYLECPSKMVDVNVHPAKAEVRFRDAGMIRGLIVSALRNALSAEGHRASPIVSTAMLGAFQPEWYSPAIGSRRKSGKRGFSSPQAEGDIAGSDFVPTGRPELLIEKPPSATVEIELDEGAVQYPLGAAKAQVHDNYIIAQNSDGIVIVDQHAAHERLVYERLKGELAENAIETRELLVPEVVDLSEVDRGKILEVADQLASLGLVIEPFGPGAVCVRQTPTILGSIDGIKLLQEILDGLDDTGDTLVLEERINAVISRMSCHGSVRSGRQLSAAEMNALLRDMESNPKSGQCNHGRPTYVKLALSDIEKLFGRT